MRSEKIAARALVVLFCTISCACEAPRSTTNENVVAPSTSSLAPKKTSPPHTTNTDAAPNDEVLSPLEAPIVKTPEGAAPPSGWPIVVMMHGYNSNHRDFGDAARIAASKGLLAVSIPAPIQGSRPGGYMWKRGDFSHTDRYIQAILSDVRGSVSNASAGRVWLVGFSQGGLHASSILAAYPERYRGVLAVSPAGWTPVPESITASELPRDVVVVGGEREKPRYMKTTSQVEALWRTAGVSVASSRHPGGHHFPPGWRESFAKIFGAWAQPTP